MMGNVNELPAQSDVHIAPLQFSKGHSRASSKASKGTSNNSVDACLQTESIAYGSQMTPPATPNGSQEDLEPMEPAQPVFHNFLRAFYPFHPTVTASDTTITLPLNEGDVILVHSIHTNGWADGTLLLSGARGWLPTNYCESYEPDNMRNLLKALLNFWDLLRCGLSPESEVFGNQEFIRGIIAGVRFLLEKSNCLTRESVIIQTNESLRRSRKALLSDLSSLVKTAKRLQELISPAAVGEPEEINDILDDMVLKAFKIVTRAVRFLDLLDDDARSRQAINKAAEPMPTVIEESYIPPTPPAEITLFAQAEANNDAWSRRTSFRSSVSGTSASQTSLAGAEQTKRLSLNKRLSSTFANASAPVRPPSVQLHRVSMSHRVSIAGLPSTASRENLVSERLNSSHDTLLSYLGSFIGRLHVQSQSPADLLLTTRQSISSGRALLAVVEAACAHDSQSEEALQHARDTMYHCINHLILVARECIRPMGSDEYDIMMPHDSSRLKDAATDCVVAAGECVAMTKFVIERTGDFEMNTSDQGLGIDMSAFTIVEESTSNAPLLETPQDPAMVPLPPPSPSLTTSTSTTTLYDKPLPHVPEGTLEVLSTGHVAEAVETMIEPPKQTNKSPSLSLLPPLPHLTSPFMAQEEYSPSESAGTDSEMQKSFRSGSITMSAGTSSTYLSSMRDSESSMISQTSTRATTPDTVPYHPFSQLSNFNINTAGSATGSAAESQTTLAEDADEAESKIMEKTFAHELIFNKEGQITGGSLPALVERLTTHDSTPDAIFVSTFYLTFRLFVSPVDFANALVDRFDYVADSPVIAGPVRLRVYNVFKGWIESHWRSMIDVKALPIIEIFATTKLNSVLPAAARRLLELAKKVSSTDGPLVPRLVSSIGKTSTSVAQYVSPDTPMPNTIIGKSQLSALKNWKMGGNSPSILDFDPLELARQLTIKEMNIFCSIMPEELLGSEWMKKSGSNAINVRAMSTLSTDLSNLVADTILQYDDAKKRAVLIKHWIKISLKCLELNNYDSLMAIICSLNSSTILRLKKTWDMVSQKRKDALKSLQDIVEPTKNHLVLRQRLQNHVPPCLPFVGTFLTDLYFVDIGNQATKQIPTGSEEAGLIVINFDKHARTAKIIGELQRFQIPYRLHEIPEMQEWMQAQIIRVRCSNDLNNAHQYYRKSLLLEPRAASTRPSPIETQSSFSSISGSKEKFDLFSWTHSKEKTSGSVTPITTA